MRPIERPHVVERDPLQSADRAAVVMAVRMARVDHVVEIFLPELLVVALAQRHLQKVEGGIAYAGEVLLPKAWIQQHVFQQRVIPVEILDVRGAAEDGHLLVDLPVDGGRHRVHGVDDLLIGHRPRAALREHRGRERREPLFALGIERRACREQDPEDDQRRGPGLQHARRLRKRRQL
jgi:hypothetical protein